MRTGLVLPLLGSLFLAGCSSAVVHDLDEGEANQILGVLQQRGIAAEKLRSVEGNRVRYTVQVGRGQAAQAWQVLQQENLPRPRPPGVSELFGKPGLVPTATQERTLAHHALAGELARTLQSVEGVLEARVHLVLAARDPLSPPEAAAPSARASVLLRLAASGSAPSTASVQRLVAGAVEGLTPEAVTVVETRAAAAAPVDAARLDRVGPFQVAASSRAGLRAALIAGVSLLLLLCLALMWLAGRHRRLLRTSRSQEAPSASAVPSAQLESSLGLLSRSLAARPGSRVEPPRDESRSPR